ncbi:MAG TPA: hypothetical protein DHV70_06825 [Firmicutes bacterium]|nr:hypothetical protein [Bacillota bacterium]
MNIEEYIDNIKNSNLKKSIKNKRLLIINTKLVKDKMYNEIESDIKKFIIEFNMSGLEYDIEPKINRMIILLKGDILNSDFCKMLESKNIEFTADELLNYIHSTEFNNGDNLDDVKLNIKLYKLLENINEKNINLKSILLNTINVILEKNYDKIDSNEFNIITKELVQNNTLDELTFKYILEFYNYIESDNLELK